MHGRDSLPSFETRPSGTPQDEAEIISHARPPAMKAPPVVVAATPAGGRRDSSFLALAAASARVLTTRDAQPKFNQLID